MEHIGPLLKQRLEHIIIENELLRAGFAAFPYAVLKDRQLSVGARLTYGFLLMYGWQEGSCFAGQKKMAADMGVSDRQLQRYLYELRDTGYIAIERRDKRYNNTYIIVDKRPTKLRKAKNAVKAGRRA
jgi:hypothetical protein